MNNICKKPLFNGQECLYTGGICHKEYFLMLCPNCSKVVVLNKCLSKIGEIETNKYQSITENKKECYFILTKLDDKDNLYKTTYDFLEFDSIKLNVPNKYKEKINDIYYDCEEKRIFVTTSNYVYSVTLDGYFIKEENESNICVSSRPIVNNLKGGCCRTVSNRGKIFTAIGKCQKLYVSYIENEESFLSLLSCEGTKDPICIGKDVKVVSIFTCHRQMYLLLIKNNKYNYLYEISFKCVGCDHDQCIPGCEELNCHQHHPCKRPCQDPVGCILESIALVETGIAHILNAEGEKIQKAIADKVSICELLKINKSVTETIFNTTMLEHVLQEKIARVLEYSECPKEHECEKHCECSKCHECEKHCKCQKCHECPKNHECQKKC